MNIALIELKENDLIFAKETPDVILPTKDDENAGYDIYAHFDEDYMTIPPHTTKLIPTGIASAMSPKYEIRLCDRGSNGSKGIHVNAGTIDSGFRGFWFVAWCNTNDKPVILSKLSLNEIIKKYGNADEEDTWFIPINPSEPTMLDGKPQLNNMLLMSYNKPIIYPYEKAICQAELREVPVMNVKEVSLDELLSIPSNRGIGALGSSGK